MTIAARPEVTAAELGHEPSPKAAQRSTVALVLAAAAAAIGVVIAWKRASLGATVTGVDVGLVVARGLAYVAAGLIAWKRTTPNRVARLLMAVGFASFLLPLAVATGPAAFFSLARGLDFLYVAVLFHLVLAYPTGHLTSSLERAVVVGFYVVLGLIGLARIATCALDATWEANACFSVSALVIHSSAALSDALQNVYLYGAFVLLLLTLVIIVRRCVTSVSERGPGGGVLTLVLLTAAAHVGVYLFLAATELWIRLSGPESAALFQAQSWIEVALPAAFLLALLRPRLARASIARLVVELREPRAPGQLRPALARALADPSLELGLWAPDTGRYIDPQGRPFQPPPPGSGRAASELRRGDEPLAILVHDPRLLDDPGLVEAVGAAAGLALENERLQAAVRAQLEEVRASRSRIVQAADAERSRVERDLHDGAQQRLLTLGLALRRAQRRLDGRLPDVEPILAEAAAELDAALDEIRELARGLYPAILTDEGLGPALQALADRSPVRAVLATTLECRLPRSVETTAYFVVSEALSNIAKHARATKVGIRAERTNGILVVEVTDDGIGGADATLGSGLRGLTDRVAAVGGTLRVESQPERGTSLIAELPCR